ncbi:MAG: RagB/SusD family nutrient uptake outer membrane protein [Saprospiraceae bacterium]|nr:RagB/SusD family nutrient uptake outer membrane protein [Saprospiraceae bacterium]MDW8483754.1 RagB/SusD family nutrient uptake outer membrane protein [Saprospiraceae bacterium]
MKYTVQIPKTVALLVTAALLIFFPNSCRRDLLDPVPINTLADATAFATPDRFLSNLNGLYAQLKSGQFYGGRFLVYNDVRGEEFLNETGNGVTALQTWNHSVFESSSEVINLWTAAYQTINSCNIYIDRADRNRSVVGNDALVDQYIAEARFLRALCYHSLARMYCPPYIDAINNPERNKYGLPLRLRPEIGPGNNDLARSTVTQVYNQILEDLNAAEPKLAANHGTALLNVTRAHRNTAIALKARVYMGMQRYSDALTELNKIVPAAPPFRAPSGVPHELQANIRNVFAPPYTTSESIFSMPFTSNNLPGTQNGLGSYYNPGPRGIGDYSLNPKGIIGDSVAFPGNDARRQFVLIHTNNKPYLNKFPTGPEHLDYAPVLRYAEMLLHVAEAEARVNGINARALAALNAVRLRSNPSAAPYTSASFASVDAFIDAVLKERRVEFLGEGHRAFDIQRLLLPFPAKGPVGSVAPNVSEYIWPIPSTERTANKLIIPNP